MNLPTSLYFSLKFRMPTWFNRNPFSMTNGLLLFRRWAFLVAALNSFKTSEAAAWANRVSLTFSAGNNESKCWGMKPVWTSADRNDGWRAKSIRKLTFVSRPVIWSDQISWIEKKLLWKIVLRDSLPDERSSYPMPECGSCPTQPILQSSDHSEQILRLLVGHQFQLER